MVIYDLFRVSNRSVVAVNTKYIPKSRKFEQFFLNKELKVYNKLSKSVKGLDNHEFKSALKGHLNRMQISDSMD